MEQDKISPKTRLINSHDGYVNAVYLAAKDTIVDIKNKNVNAVTLISLATNLMTIVEKYDTLKGNAKKEIVLAVIRRVLRDDVPTDSAELELLLTVADRILPAVIDRIVAASRGEIDLNKTAQTVKKIARKFICC